MTGYLRRLATTGAAYTASSVTSKLIAVALLPLYTRYLTPADYGAAEVLIAGLVIAQRRRLALLPDRGLLRRMLRWGLPTMPAELSLYSLNFIDRVLIVRLVGLGDAGLYSLSVKFAQAVNVLVKGFQLAWPPLAYSITDDDEARRAYAVIVTWFVSVCTFVVV